jgi:hypothetical protein
MTKEIDVKLIRKDDKDLLLFTGLTDKPKETKQVELSNDVNAQKELKELFCALLPLLIEEPVQLKLTYDDTKDNELFRTVANEYVTALNAELQQSRKTFVEDYSKIAS